MQKFSIQLPSLCKAYKGVDPNGVTVQPFNGEDEEILATAQAANVRSRVTEVLKRTVEGVDVASLTLGDRSYLMLWHAVNSFDDGFEQTIGCQSCGQSIVVKYNLKDLPVDKLADSYVEPYSITLSSGPVTCRLITVKDEVAAAAWTAQGGNDYLYLYALTTKIPGCDSVADVLEALKKWPAKDFQLIKAFHEKFYHGPVFAHPYTCPLCGYKGDMVVPFRFTNIIPNVSKLRQYYGKQI